MRKYVPKHSLFVFFVFFAFSSCYSPHTTPGNSSSLLLQQYAGKQGFYVVKSPNTILNKYAALTEDAPQGSMTISVSETAANKLFS